MDMDSSRRFGLNAAEAPARKEASKQMMLLLLTS